MDLIDDSMTLHNVNGVEFFSEHPREYFTRNRSKRLDKKLYVGTHMTVVLESTIVLKEEPEGDDSGFPYIIDDVIDSSYDHNDVLNKNYHVSMVGCDKGTDGNFNLCITWEVKAPSNEVYQKNSVSIVSEIKNLFPNDEVYFHDRVVYVGL